MALQDYLVNIGQSANDKSGDPLRVAFEKINGALTELYATDITSTYQIGDETQFVRIELDGEGVPTGGITIHSGYDTSMPVYIKGGNCAQDGVGGNVIIEAGAPPLAAGLIQGAGPYAGTVGDIELSANQTTIESLGNTWTFGSDGNLQFPTGCFIGDTYSDGGLSLQATADHYVGLNSSDLKQYLEVNDSGIYIGTDYPVNDYSWVFDKSGILNLPPSTNENAVIQSPYSIELIAGVHNLMLDTSGNLTLDGNPIGGADVSTRSVSFWSTATPAEILSPTTDVIMCDTQAAGGTVGFIMPAPNSISVGKTITIKNIHGTHAIYVSGSVGGTVAIETEFGLVGSGTYTTISANNAFATFIWDGSAWRIINRHGI